jgi:hypothetical protein
MYHRLNHSSKETEVMRAMAGNDDHPTYGFDPQEVLRQMEADRAQRQQQAAGAPTELPPAYGYDPEEVLRQVQEDRALRQQYAPPPEPRRERKKRERKVKPSKRERGPKKKRNWAARIIGFFLVLSVGSALFNNADKGDSGEKPPSDSDRPPAAALPATLSAPPNSSCVKGRRTWCGTPVRNATTIIDVGRKKRLPRRAWEIGVMTAMQESSIRSLSNPVYPSTKALGQGVGKDHDSVGIFQQRPKAGWGSPTELMNPRVASEKFYTKLVKIKGWQSMPRWTAAQKVQVSCCPRAYNKHEADAIKVVAHILAYNQSPTARNAAKLPASGSVMFQCSNSRSRSCRQVDYRLVQPVVDNRLALAKHFPDMRYKGDIGDDAHQNASPPQDHTPGARGNKSGWVYAQDLGDGGGFDLPQFNRWLLDNLRKGKYREVKYVICRLPQMRTVAGGRYYGFFSRRNGWRREASSGHENHCHISYMPGYERRSSKLIAEYAAWARSIRSQQ